MIDDNRMKRTGKLRCYVAYNDKQLRGYIWDESKHNAIKKAKLLKDVTHIHIKDTKKITVIPL